MGKEKLTFENYHADHSFDSDLDYRYEHFFHGVNLGLDYDKKKVEQEKKLDREGQQKAEKYNDGLHGYDYFSIGGQGKTELEVVLKRYESIPMSKWILATGATDVKKDRKETFDRLRAAAPPDFMNSSLTAAERKALSTREKKMLDKQLSDYKEMRKNWEESAKGKVWVEEIQRLKDMEEGKLPENVGFSQPTNVRKVTSMAGVFTDAHMDPEQAGQINLTLDVGRYEGKNGSVNERADFVRPDAAGLFEALRTKYEGADYDASRYNADMMNASGTIKVAGINYQRLAILMERSLGAEMTNAQIEKLYDKLMAPHKTDLDKNDPAAVAAADAEFDEGMLQLKEIYHKQLKRIENTFGTLITQMHPDDFLRQAGPKVKDYFAIMQDVGCMMDCSDKYFDFEHSEADREFKRLADYYFHAWYAMQPFLLINYARTTTELDDVNKESLISASMLMPPVELVNAEKLSDGVGGPHMDKKQERKYLRGLKERAEKQGFEEYLFGKYAQ